MESSPSSHPPQRAPEQGVVRHLSPTNQVLHYLDLTDPIDLSQPARTTIVALSRWANKDRICWPKQAKIAHRAGISNLKTVQAALVELREMGWISYKATGGKVITSCTYEIHPERWKKADLQVHPLARKPPPPPPKGPRGPRQPADPDAAPVRPRGKRRAKIQRAPGFFAPPATPPHGVTDLPPGGMAYEAPATPPGGMAVTPPGALAGIPRGGVTVPHGAVYKSLQSTFHLKDSMEEEERRSQENSYKSSPSSSLSSMDSERTRDLDKVLGNDHPHPQRRGPAWNKGVFLDRWEKDYAFAHHPALPSLVIGEGHLAVARRKGLDPVQEVALFLATLHESRNWPKAFMTWLERDDGRKRSVAGEEAHPPERGPIRTKLVELYFAGLDPMFPGEDRTFAPHHYAPHCPCEGCELGLTDPPPDP